MASQTVSGGQTYNQTHDVRRELPYITGFPSLQGIVTSVKLDLYVRYSSGFTTRTIYPGVFKTFTLPSNKWVEENNSRYRQNTQDVDSYVNASNWHSYCTDLLVNSYGASISRTGDSNQAYSYTTPAADITDWGKNLANWGGGKLIIALLTNDGGLYWGNNTTCALTVNYNAGSIVYYYNGSAWVKTVPYYYNGSEWKACQVSHYNGSSWTQC